MIRRRPTLRSSDSNWIKRGLLVVSLGLSLSLSLGLVGASTAFAQDEPAAAAEPTEPVSTGEAILTGLAKAQDALFIRPLATIRVILGAAFMVPAAVFSAPMGMDGIQQSYDVLIDAPLEYAFRRPLGDFGY